MENKNIFPVIAILIIILLFAGGAMIYSQQKAISRLNALIVSGSASQTASSGAGATSQNQQVPGGANSMSPASAVEAEKERAKENGNYIVGKITRISGNDLTVEADIIDWDKMKELASSQNKSADYMSNPPTVKKTYSVSTNGNTQFLASKLGDLHVSDSIWVTSSDKVYQTDKITATQILSPYRVSSPAAPPGQ